MSSKVNAGPSNWGLEAVDERLSSDALRKLFSLTNKDFGRGLGLNPVGDGRGASLVAEDVKPPANILVSFAPPNYLTNFLVAYKCAGRSCNWVMCSSLLL